MNDLVAIYVLRDPCTGLVRYVGKAVDPHKRFRKHLVCATATHCSRWIFSLLARGTRPVLEVARWVLKAEWEVAERDLIQFFREVSPVALTNISEGGCGGATGLKRSPETCAKLAAVKLGRKRKPFSQEWKKKVAAALLGNKYMLGQKRSLESRMKQSAATLGVKRGTYSPERVAAMVAARWPVKSKNPQI